MKLSTVISALLLLGSVVPSGVFALDVEALIEAAKNGNGTYVESHSSVSTGGQTAQSGETVVTGDARATTYTEIRSGSEGGSVQVRLETEENGELEVREVTKDISKGEGVRVEATASSIDGVSTDEVRINGETVDTTPTTTQSTSNTEESGSYVRMLFVEKIPSFFKKMFGYFAW